MSSRDAGWTSTGACMFCSSADRDNQGAGRSSRCGKIVVDCLISHSPGKRIGSPYQKIGRSNEARLGNQYHKANQQPHKRIWT